MENGKFTVHKDDKGKYFVRLTVIDSRVGELWFDTAHMFSLPEASFRAAVACRELSMSTTMDTLPVYGFNGELLKDEQGEEKYEERR